ncbi:PREDICTED: uncharacterized protein LOC109588811 [Amphimedon queenslandica]|uniref:Uncharacterized protein n=1 Tax=Amphimedon queenslandica TaxID=400682 RepID=A0AAN0JUC1_AMPQE|nr:PREDICTED: uncharacterized protein LOC109588811 [Amphimedon queenslandica]|eukprot:XP_019860487.1 PREDICTED: uncharacterized protein LOC109588811 [Amphimedon queenslandica]
MWSQEDSAKEIITIGNFNLFLDDIASLLNVSSLSEKHAMYFLKLLAFEQKHKEPYNEDYYGAIELVSFEELLECSKTKKAVDFDKLNPLRSVKNNDAIHMIICPIFEHKILLTSLPSNGEIIVYNAHTDIERKEALVQAFRKSVAMWKCAPSRRYSHWDIKEIEIEANDVNDAAEAMCKLIAASFGKIIDVSITTWIINTSLHLSESYDEEMIQKYFPQILQKNNEREQKLDDIVNQLNQESIFENDPESKGFLIPNFLNKPNVNDDDICTFEFDWGKEWYLNHFPVLDRSKSDSDCIFKREFIRKAVKKNESHLREIYWIRSGFSEGIIKRRDLYDSWPLELDDMYFEIQQYLFGLEGDILQRPVLILMNSKMWPETMTILLMEKFDIKYEDAVEMFKKKILPTA